MLANWVLESQAALVPPAHAAGLFRHKSSQASSAAPPSARRRAGLVALRGITLTTISVRIRFVQ